MPRIDMLQDKLKEKDIEIKGKDKEIKALKRKTRPRSLSFYRSRFNA